MNPRLRTLRGVFAIGVAWGILWALITTAIGLIVWAIDPASIDPGESPLVVGPFFLGPMGLLSGVAFGILLSLVNRGGTVFDLSLTRVAMWGFLASSIVQLGYLGHGDLGLVDNIRVGLLLCAFGASVAMVWLVLARRWSYRRSSLRSSREIPRNP